MHDEIIPGEGGPLSGYYELEVYRFVLGRASGSLKAKL